MTLPGFAAAESLNGARTRGLVRLRKSAGLELEGSVRPAQACYTRYECEYWRHVMTCQDWCWICNAGLCYWQPTGVKYDCGSC